MNYLKGFASSHPPNHIFYRMVKTVRFVEEKTKERGGETIDLEECQVVDDKFVCGTLLRMHHIHHFNGDELVGSSYRGALHKCR